MGNIQILTTTSCCGKLVEEDCEPENENDKPLLIE